MSAAPRPRNLMGQGWRWFGPDDPVPLAHVRQAGVEEVVTALHHVPVGAAWTTAEIERRQREVREHPDGSPTGLEWTVVESLPVGERIKTQAPGWRADVEAYCESLRSLAACGIRTVCYNFMPVADWTRTHVEWPMPDGSTGLRFDATAFAAFELFILKRPGAERDYDHALRAAAARHAETMDEAAAAELTRTVVAGLPGADEHYTLEGFREALARYSGIDADRLRRHLAEFLAAVVPAAEACGVRLGIHPDDPPRPILGLPRVVGTAADCRFLLAAADRPANGLTFCTGSFGVRPDNDLPAMIAAFAPRIHFVHLRNTRREPDGLSFHESDHLDGDTDMVAVLRALLAEQARRRSEGRADWRITMRPDHGHKMLDDLGKRTNPGYSAIGRLRGLAELRGVMHALAHDFG